MLTTGCAAPASFLCLGALVLHYVGHVLFLSSLDSLRSAVQRTAGFVHLGLLLRDSLTLFCRFNPYSHSLYFCGDELPLCYHFCAIRCDHGVFLPSQNLNAGFFNRSLKRLLKRGQLPLAK